MRKEIKLKDIIIPSYMINSKPSNQKIKKKKSNLLKGKYINPIIINEDDELVDGYITWIIYSGLYSKEATVSAVVHKNITEYVFGHHPGNDRRFWWKNDSLDVSIGDLVLCKTKFGLSPVIVDDIRYEKPNIDMRIKKVVKNISVKK